MYVPWLDNDRYTVCVLLKKKHLLHTPFRNEGKKKLRIADHWISFREASNRCEILQLFEHLRRSK